MRRDVLWITAALTGDERPHVGLLSGLFDQPTYGRLAHAIGLTARKDGLSRLPGARSVAAQLSGGLRREVEIGVPLAALLQSTRKEQLGWLGGEIEMIGLVETLNR